MKRNPDLLKKILEIVEDSEKDVNSRDMEIEGTSQAQIIYHIKLLQDVDFIEADGLMTFKSENFTIHRLTMSGHDFLDASRNETAWRKTKDAMAASGGFVLKVAEQLLMEFLKQQLIQPPAP